MQEKRRKRWENTAREGLGGWLVPVGIGIGAAFGAAVALLLLAAVVAYSTDDPDRLSSPLAYAVLYLTALFGGFVSVRVRRSDALCCGLLCGAAWMGILFLASLLFQGVLTEGIGGVWVAVLRVMTVLASILGAYLGLPRAKTAKRKRKHGR